MDWRRSHRSPWFTGLLLLGVPVLGLFLLFYVKAGSIYAYQDSYDGGVLPDVDAIVCLAGGRGRITAAGDIWYRYYEDELQGRSETSPILYVSGMGPNSSFQTFQKQVRPGVLKAMRPQDVVLETESTNTEGNAVWVIRNAQLRGWKRILLVTSSYHMRRSQFMFDQIFTASKYRLQMETFSVVQDPFTVEEWNQGMHGFQVTLLEYFKWLYYTSFWKPTPVALAPAVRGL